MRNATSIIAGVFAAALQLLVPAAAAETATAGHISILPGNIRWQEAPSIGPGAQLAVLEGDLKQAEPFTFRLKLPPNFKIPPHTHPVFERVTVLSGVFHLGIGERFDTAKATAYPAGGVTMMPPGMPMFAYTTDEGAVVQLHGQGPWGITYLDPKDDPARR